MADKPKGCARVTGAVSGEQATPPSPGNGPAIEERRTTMTARIGRQAPDFQAPAFHKGKFTSVQLSDHFGTWILLCFYPGDFTFV
jgi:peroxiredoxin (alkyl hydroperoxide reductase subunit C)